MKLALWNVNGLRSIFGKGFDQFIKNENPDIFCLQEIKANQDQLSIDHLDIIKDYSGFYSSALKKGYSGVAIFAKHGIDVLNHEFNVIHPILGTEGRIVKCGFKHFDLYNIYFPSGSSGEIRQNLKYEFLDEILLYFSKLGKSDFDRTIVCGDFNICHREIDIHHPDKATKLELSGFLPNERAWMDKFCALGFIDSFRHIHGDKKQAYTWWSFRANSRAKNLGWRIDYFFVSKNLANKVLKAEILCDVKGSDHCPLTLELNI
jgi:exodeoxyribonuclease-3